MSLLSFLRQVQHSTNSIMNEKIKLLCDTVRETGYAIHKYHGPGHLEKVYENALVHRLRKAGVSVEQQHPLHVYDEDGTILGEYFADVLIEDELVIEIKAASSIAPEHQAQILGYLKSSRKEHGLLLNFGALKFQIKKFVYKDGWRFGEDEVASKNSEDSKGRG